MSEISVSIRFFNILASYAGTRQMEICLDEGATIRNVLDHLMKTGSQELRQILVRNGEFNKSLKIFHNQKLVTDDMLVLPLHGGDELMILPAMAGG